MTTRRQTPFRLIRSLCAILALCNVQLSLSSSSSSTTSANKNTISTTNQQQQDKIFKPNKRTIVSGFGAHSTKHSIFTTTTKGSSSSQTESSTTTTTSSKKSSKKQQSKSKSTQEEAESTIGDFGSKSLLVYKQDKDGDDSPDSVIWLMDPQTPNQKVCIWVNENGDWMSELVDNENTNGPIPQPPSSPTSSSELNGWAPIEGLYGFYKVPTGILLVLIAKTRNVFEAPPLSSTSNKQKCQNYNNWWRMDKVQQLEVVHLFNSKAQQELSPIQIKEEIRQLRLLRKSWKQHDFYCCQYEDDTMSAIDENENDDEGEEDFRAASSTMPIVRDMTKSLQSSFLAHQQAATNSRQQQQRRSRKTSSSESSSSPSASSSWWTANPDPRFFWNQVAVEPILAKCSSMLEEGMDLEEDMDPCTRFLLDHTIPVTSAFVGIQSNISYGKDNDKEEEEEESSASSDQQRYTQLLISRRSRFRAGTRFTRRGADANGAVANYVETEQVLLLLSQQQQHNNNGEESIDKIASHVQTRGSIPIRWSSPADVKTYRPKVHIGTDPLAQARALRWHLLEQQAHYVLLSEKNNNAKKNKGKKAVKKDDAFEMVFVNLVDKKSDQGRLGKAFDEVLQAVLDVHNNSTTSTSKESPPRPLVKHVWYDFHAEVKHGKWDRLSILLKDIEPSLMAHNYLVVSSSSNNSETKKNKNNKAVASSDYQIESKQTSMVRTNCMDCLDRTNVVQSILGRYMLFEQLLLTQGLSETKKWRKKFTKSKQLSLPWPKSEKSHRALWADNADEISRLYAGTPALKRDFTRTGQRTKLGALDDGMNSLQRYYLNNFMDADRQEGMDLMVGYASFTNVQNTNNNNGGGGSSSSSTRNHENDEEEEGDGSIFATRRSFLGGLFQPQQQSSLSSDASGGSSSEQEKDEDDDEDEEEDDINDALDLRWVPGDLQEHLRSRAEGENKDDEPSSTATTEENDPSKQNKRSLLPKLTFGFSSTRALKAMDERSTSDLPWWSLVEDDDNDDDGDVTVATTATASTSLSMEEDDSNNDGHWLSKLAPHQRHPTLTPGSVFLAVLLLGFRAPMGVAMGMVLCLGLLYLQDILWQDWEMVTNVVEKVMYTMLDDTAMEEEDDDDDDTDNEDFEEE